MSTCSVDTGEGCHSVFFVVLLNTESIQYSVFCLPKAVQMDSCCCICALNLKPKSCLNLHVLMNVLYGDLVENILVTRTKNLKWLSFSWQAYMLVVCISCYMNLSACALVLREQEFNSAICVFFKVFILLQVKF